MSAPVFKEVATDPDSGKMLRVTGRLAAVGLEMGIAVALGIGGGWYLDQKLQTKPIFFWIGFALGIGAMVKAVWDATLKARKEIADEREKPHKKD